MVLIHFALQSEAQSIIEKNRLKKFSSSPKIYKNENILVLISSLGAKNTINSLEFVFKNYQITKALNIGIVGCSKKEIKIGTLFCTNKKLESINFMRLKTVDTPQTKTENKDYLYDMEGEYFLEISKKYLKDKDIYIFKIVSDHLEEKIPSKQFVKELISNHYKTLEPYFEKFDEN